MKLTAEEKSDLLALTKKPWFKVLEKVASDMEMNVLRQFKNIDIWNPNNLAILAKNTSYLKWVEDLIKTAKSQSNQVAERKLEEKEEDK